MSYTASITDTQLFTGLRAFILNALGTGIEVVQSLDNRVPLPTGPFVVMNELFRNRIATNESEFVDTATVGPVPGVHTETLAAATEVAFQLDCYGENSGNYAQALSTAWRSHLSVDFLSTYNLVPLYNDDPRKMPVVNSENQFELRWVVTVHLQVNPSITASCEFADTFAGAEIINVDATYQ